jgi:predicted P-loop ATPase
MIAQPNFIPLEDAEEKMSNTWRSDSFDNDFIGASETINGLIVNDKGVPVANTANAMTAIRSSQAWRGVFAFDRMASKVMLLNHVPEVTGRHRNDFKPRPLTDADVVKAQEWLQHNGFPTIRKEAVGDAISAVAEERAFDPLEDRLRSLIWDGVPRIERWLLDYCGASISDTQPETYIKAVGRCWLISAAARALSPGCKVDSALVLVGPQGIGKSTAGRILGYSWFSDALPPVHSKDASDHLRGVWLVEFGEMATASRADVEELKAFITRTVERFRPAYGRLEVEYPRRNVFFGTSNRDAFLKDETGNRRFWPVEVTKIDALRLMADRNQIWAEAVHAFDSGQQWHLTEDESRLAVTQAAAFVVVDDRAELLAQKLVGRSTATALECLDLLGMKNEKREQMEVAGMLRSIGWMKKSDGTRKFWVAPRTTSACDRWSVGGQSDGDGL